jgi:hypothetical protein
MMLRSADAPTILRVWTDEKEFLTREQLVHLVWFFISIVE